MLVKKIQICMLVKKENETMVYIFLSNIPKLGTFNFFVNFIMFSLKER